jgi:hypothetical protein
MIAGLPVDWREEWERNPRLRLGAWLAGALLALWGLLAAADRLDEQVAERDRVAAQVQRLRSVAQDSRWAPYRDDVRVIDGQWRSRLWREPTEGRMQAALLDWLRSQASAAGLVPRELSATVLPPPDPEAARPQAAPALPAGIRVVRARVTVDVSPLVLHELLARLVQAPGLTRLNRLVVATGDRRVTELEVEALFTAGEAPETR